MMKTNNSRYLLRWVLSLVMLFSPSAHADTPTILVLGDSLSAGYGIAANQGWVKRLQDRLVERGFPHRVVNASISGDTTDGGLSRLPAALERERPTIVILEMCIRDRP